ncbi:hypothetical protein [Pseudomonas lini]|uniref:hypothetical protein n=1 Tax=Pseudomonas lini TaxID=163011 RepID=UPI00345ECE47
MKRLVAVSLIALATTGCDQINRKMAEHFQKASLEMEFDKDLSSPDNALKSWWRFLDADDQRSYESCQKYFENQPAREKYYSAFTTGDVLSVKTNQIRDCRLDSYSREIQEVKQETETRAVVLATIKNTTSSSMNPTETEKADREKGSTYRYLIEKDSSGWKISKVFKLSTYSFDKNDPWKPEYKRHPDYYPSRPISSQ